MSRSLLLSLINDMIAQGAERVLAEQRDRAVDLAMVRYSADRPRLLVQDVLADGSRVLPWPTGWEAGRSVLRGIETPPDNMPPTELDADAWGIYTTPSGPQIRLSAALPEGQPARLTFSAPHVLSEAVCTVPTEHLEAVASYAAGTLCEQIATQLADNADATIQADRIDQTSPAREWARRANSLRNRYFAVLGIAAAGGTPNAKPAPASAVVDMDLAPTFGRPFLYPRGRR